MNEIKLRGKLDNIEFSHMIGNMEYSKSNLIVPRENGWVDIIPLRFRTNSNNDRYKAGDEIALTGNIRSYSRKLETGKSKVNIYVFTYLDPVAKTEIYNEVNLDGRVCKKDKIRNSEFGDRFHIILANNIIINDTKKINNYLPVVFYGDLAHMANNLNVNDKIKISGSLHSRTYKKVTNNYTEVKTAIEVVANTLEIL